MRSAAVWIFMALPLYAQDSGRSAGVPIAGQPGLVIRDGIAGTEEGHALSELHYWISWEDYDLAEAAYRLGCREIKSPSVRFVRSWSLLRWAVAKKKGFDRAVAALEEIQAQDKELRDHIAALVKSVRAVMPCAQCDGKGRVCCIRCYGAGEIRGDSDDPERSPCDACERGELKCPKCAGPRPAPSLNDVCSATPCGPCGGRGLPLKAVRWPCAECRGLGQKLVPKADPAKTLP